MWKPPVQFRRLLPRRPSNWTAPTRHGVPRLFLVVQLAFWWPGVAWAQKTDVIILNNGDHVIVEIKRLERGRLEAKTDDMGTLSVEWEDVQHVSSPAVFEVTLATGVRYVGSLARTDSAGEVVVAALPPVTLALDRIVQITPIDESFWFQWDGSIDVGYTFSKAGDTTQLTLSGILKHRAESVDTTIDGSSYFSSKEGAEDTNRHSFGITVLRNLGQRWGVALLGHVEQNDELNLSLRSQVGGGYTQHFVQTNAILFSGLAGAVLNREEFSDETAGQTTVEAAFAVDFQAFAFETPKTDVTVRFVAFPSLSDWGRTRLDLDVRVRQELVKDLFFSVAFQDSFDSAPPSESAGRNDFNVVTSLGWSF